MPFLAKPRQDTRRAFERDVAQAAANRQIFGERHIHHSKNRRTLCLFSAISFIEGGATFWAISSVITPNPPKFLRMRKGACLKFQAAAVQVSASSSRASFLEYCRTFCMSQRTPQTVKRYATIEKTAPRHFQGVMVKCSKTARPQAILHHPGPSIAGELSTFSSRTFWTFQRDRTEPRGQSPPRKSQYPA